MSGVRQQTRREALALFLLRGYEGASLRDIAAAVGVTPAALYYHYRTKDALLDDLIDPLLTQTEELVAQAERERARRGDIDVREFLHRLLDVLLAHRRVFAFVSGDIGVQNHPATGLRIKEVNQRLRTLLGSDEDPAGRLITSAALGVLFRPVTRHPDDPIEEVRDTLVEGVLAVLDLPVRP